LVESRRLPEATQRNTFTQRLDSLFDGSVRRPTDLPNFSTVPGSRLQPTYRPAILRSGSPPGPGHHLESAFPRLYSFGDEIVGIGRLKSARVVKIPDVLFREGPAA